MLFRAGAAEQLAVSREPGCRRDGQSQGQSDPGTRVLLRRGTLTLRPYAPSPYSPRPACPGGLRL